MPNVKKVAGKVQVDIERFDGGLNTKDSPSRINEFESPDCLNVVFDDQGSVSTREGTSYFNASVIETGSNVIDGLTDYNGTMIAWAGGDMFRASGTTFVTVPSAQGKFSSGVKVAYEQYQGYLFCSDGTNGPWRYSGGDDFYNMGVDQPSAPTGLSDTSGGGDIASDVYYYAVSFIGTHVIEGEVGSASAGVTITGSAAIDVSDIPVGSSLAGVDKRNVYRATSSTGPWLFVKELADNVTTSFEDNVAVGSEGSESVADGTSPKPFNTIKLHRERLFMDDSDNRTLLRYTDFSNPHISQALNFLALLKGDGSNITAIGVQDDLVSAFKTKSIWLINMADPSDDTTWGVLKAPSNMGIVGPRAFIETNNGIMFVGKRNERITGFHLLSGIDVLETSNRILRTRSISERIEPTVFLWPSSLWDDISMIEYKSRIYVGSPKNDSSSVIDGIMWFDIDRLGDQGQPGSWSPWDGVIGSNDFAVSNGILYGGSSTADGYVLQFNNGTYTDADGSAINSYFNTKEYGGEAAIESWIKDWRWLNLWYKRLGGYFMNVTWLVDGVSERMTQVDLTPPQNVWGDTPVGGEAGTVLIWSSGPSDKDANNLWAGPIRNFESQHPLGAMTGRRAQIKFDNQNVAGQGFKINSLKLIMNLRRQR